MLYLEYRLDFNNSNIASGNCFLIVKCENFVVDVAICRINSDSICNTFCELSEKYGTIYVHQNDTCLFDHEWLYLELSFMLREKQEA